MKIPFSIYLLFVVIISYGQNGINVPLCDYVQTEYNFQLLVPLSLNKKGNLIIENNVILDKSGFDKNITDKIVNQFLNGDLICCSTFKFEIQIDSSCSIEKVDSIFKFMAGRSFNKLFLVAKTQTSSRIESIYSTGIDYEIESIQIQNNLTKKIVDETGVPPSPPPPPLGWNKPFKSEVPTTYSVNNYRNHKDIIEIYKIQKLQNQGLFSINDNIYNEHEFQLEIRKLLQYNFCAFELILERNSTYSDFVDLLSPIKFEIQNFRNKYANDNFGQAYYNLGYSDKIIVVDAYPDLIQLFVQK